MSQSANPRLVCFKSKLRNFSYYRVSLAKLLRHLGIEVRSLHSDFVQAHLAACQTAFISERLGYSMKVFKQPCLYLFM